MKSYSQNAEDILILERVKKLTGPRMVLDIGAYDGTTFSNSRALIEAGWAAVLVEPNPFAFSELLRLYFENREVVLINAAVGPESRLVQFYAGGIYSTTSKANRDKFEKEAEWKSYLVPQITVETLVTQVKMRADVVSVDAEGMSFDILRNMPINAWCPHVIIVEHDARPVEIATWARMHGYEVTSLTPENIVLLREGV